MSQLSKSLKEFQANSVVYYNLVLGFHLNTESVLMRQSRIVFKDIYEQVNPTIYEVSESLRRMGEESLYTLEEYSYHQTLGQVKPDTYCGVEMTQHLLPITNKMVDHAKLILELAYIQKEFDVIDTFNDILKKYKTWSWFLESSLKLPPNPWKSLKD